jgi:hypothetical protein
MKKVALVFALAVFVPSLLLAWLAVRTLRDQQFLLERQHSMLHQALADAKAEQIQAVILEHQRAFSEQVNALLRHEDIQQRARSFDELLRQHSPLAEVGFVVTMAGDILSPSPFSRPETRKFLAENSLFLANREVAEVYSNAKQASEYGQAFASATPEPEAPLDKQVSETKFPLARKVIPQKLLDAPELAPKHDLKAATSKVFACAAEFGQVTSGETNGTIARFVNNRLSVLFWHRPARAPQFVFNWRCPN